MNNTKNIGLSLLTLSSTISLLHANDNMLYIKDKIMLETSPDILITKDILRSEVLNEMVYKLKTQKLLRLQKAEELKYKELSIKESDLLLKLKENKVKLDKLNTELLKANFEQEKILKRREFLKEYPFTTLKFKPDAIDLIYNILKSNIENKKIQNINKLKKINENNLNILKTQYLLLKKFELYYNNLYFNIINKNFNEALKNYDKINNILLQLLETNILYMQDKFSKFRIKVIKLKENLNALKILYKRGLLSKYQEKEKETLTQYEEILNLYYEIRNSLLRKIIQLQQINQNEFKLIELIGKKNRVKLKINKKSKKIKENKKRNKNFISTRMSKEEILDYKKRLAVELNVPLKYLKYLSYEDIINLRLIDKKISFYKKMLNNLENANKPKLDKYLIIYSKILKFNKVIDSKIILENKLLDILTAYIKEKYLIIDKAILKYKRILRKKKLEEERRRKMLERKRRLMEKKKMLELKLRKQREKELERKRLLELKKQEELRRKREKYQKERRKYLKILNNIKKEFSKLTYIGNINNKLSFENKRSEEIIYLYKGKRLFNNRYIILSINETEIKLLDNKYGYKIIYNIKTKKAKFADEKINTKYKFY